MTEQEQATITQYLKTRGANGGHARANALTAKQRTAIARKAAKARWRKAALKK